MDRRTFVTSLAALGGASMLPSAGQAQAAYPSRQVTMIVPFPPGGQADISARPVAEFMRKAFGQNVIVEPSAHPLDAVGRDAAGEPRPAQGPPTEGHTFS